MSGSNCNTNPPASPYVACRPGTLRDTQGTLDATHGSHTYQAIETMDYPDGASIPPNKAAKILAAPSKG